MQLAREREGVAFAVQRKEETCGRQQHVLMAARVERPLDCGDGVNGPALPHARFGQRQVLVGEAGPVAKCASLVIASSRISAASAVSSLVQRKVGEARDAAATPFRLDCAPCARRERGRCRASVSAAAAASGTYAVTSLRVDLHRLLGLAPRARHVPGIQ